MELLVVALLALVLGAVLGLLGGAIYTGRLIGEALRHEIDAGRLSQEEASRLSDLPGVRSRSRV